MMMDLIIVLSRRAIRVIFVKVSCSNTTINYLLLRTSIVF